MHQCTIQYNVLHTNPEFRTTPTTQVLSSEECKKEVFYFQKMEADDYRNDVLLAEACRMDVDAHCKNVVPGAATVWALRPRN